MADLSMPPEVRKYHENALSVLESEHEADDLAVQKILERMKERANRMTLHMRLLAEAGIEVELAPGIPTVSTEHPNVSVHSQKLGLRDTIRQILDANTGVPLSPKQVFEKVSGSGFEDDTDTKTPLKVRVGNELWRMSQRGEAQKDGRRYYVGELKQLAL